MFEEELEDYEAFSFGKFFKTILWENPVSWYVIWPVFRVTGKALGFIIPNFIK